MTDALNLTPSETANRLRVSISTLANWRVSGEGPRYIKFGRRVVYPVNELETYEQDHLRTAVSAKVGR